MRIIKIEPDQMQRGRVCEWIKKRQATDVKADFERRVRDCDNRLWRKLMKGAMLGQNQFPYPPG